MGEAKRRHEAKAKTEGLVQYFDPGADETQLARDGGDFEAYIARMKHDVATGDLPSVPCNGCVECCYHKVEVHPDRDAENLPYLLTESSPNGGLQLQHRPDGACIHLGDHGCTIYAHRPQACRKYDCRILAMFRIPDNMPGGHQAPAWVFRTNSPRGRMLKQAYRLAGLQAAAELKDKNADTIELLRTALDRLPGVVRRLTELSRMTPEQLIDRDVPDPSVATEPRS